MLSIANQEYIKVKYIIEVEDNSTIEQGILVEVDTPLDIISIAL